MFKFEAMKNRRKKVPLLILIASFLLSLLTYLYSSLDVYPYIVNENMRMASAGYLGVLDLDAKEYSYLSKEDKGEINKKRIELDIDFARNRGLDPDDLKNEKQALDFVPRYKKYLDQQEQLRQEYRVKLDPKTETAWNWMLFEADYMVKTSTPVSQLSHAAHSTNPMRLLLYRSNILFGLPILIILVFLFSPTLSREKETGTLSLLRTQPLGRARILLSKFLSIFLSGLLLTILTLGFSLLIYVLAGYPWLNGHLEIYRVFGDDPYAYMTGGELLVQILFAYALLLAFFSAVFLLISSLSSNSESAIAISTVLLILFSVLTKYFEALQSPWNPLYLLGIKNLLTGHIDSDGQMSKYVAAEGLTNYYYYFFASFVLLFLAGLFMYSNPRHKEKTKDRELSSLFTFERMKITDSQTFKILAFGSFSILLIFLITNTFSDRKLEARYKKGYLTSELDLKLEELKERKDNHINDKPLYEEEDDLETYQEELNTIDAEYKECQERYDQAASGYDYLRNGESQKYYELFIYDLESKIKQEETFPNPMIQGGAYTKPSLLESQALYAAMKEEEIQPVMTNWLIQASDYEDFLASALLFNKDNISSNTAAYSIYRNMKDYHLDVFILLAIAFMAFAGYTLDKENGDQLDLLFTQPVRRSSYHFNKYRALVRVGLTLLLIFFAVTMAYGLVTEGVGDFRQPVVYYEKLVDPASITGGTDYFRLLPVWQYNLKALAALALEILFLSTLALLISIGVKEKRQVFLITLAVAVGGRVASAYLPESIRRFSPFIHLRAREIANGSIRIHYQLANYVELDSLISLLASTAVLYLVSLLVIRKKEVK